MFVTPDSVVPDMFDPQSMNRYAYCRNNPLIYTDPSGHSFGEVTPGGKVDCINGKGTPTASDQDKKALNDYFNIKGKNTTLVKGVVIRGLFGFHVKCWIGIRTDEFGLKVRVTDNKSNKFNCPELFNDIGDLWKGTISQEQESYLTSQAAFRKAWEVTSGVTTEVIEPVTNNQVTTDTAQIAGDIMTKVGEIEYNALDTALNNPVSDVLDAIPPGESTGYPAVDIGLDIFGAVKDIWNGIFHK